MENNDLILKNTKVLFHTYSEHPVQVLIILKCTSISLVYSGSIVFKKGVLKIHPIYSFISKYFLFALRA